MRGKRVWNGLWLHRSIRGILPFGRRIHLMNLAAGMRPTLTVLPAITWFAPLACLRPA